MFSFLPLDGVSLKQATLLGAFVSLSASVSGQILWQESADCDETNQVLCPTEPWEQGQVWHPWVICEEDEDVYQYKMWYTGTNPDRSIGLAVSADGMVWEKHEKNPVLEPEEAWASSILNGPCVIVQKLGQEIPEDDIDRFVFLIDEGEFKKANKIYKMWYAGRNGRTALGYAESLDGVHWKRFPGNPVMEHGESGSFDSGNVLEPSVLFDAREGIYRMWYAAWRDNIARTGYATSEDGLVWENRRLVLDVGASWESVFVMPSNVLKDERAELYQMWYTGWDGVEHHLGYATSPDGSDWTKHERNPLRDLGVRANFPAVLFDREENIYKMWFGATTSCIEFAASAPERASVPSRDVSAGGDPGACPPGGGPVLVTIQCPVAGEDPAEIVTVREVVSGPLDANAVQANQGGEVTNRPVNPVAPLGMFQDARLVLTVPDCSGQPGDWSASHDDNGTAEDPADDSYTLAATGQEIWINGDTFAFAYAAVKGDFTFTAHVKERQCETVPGWGKHGLMARQDLSSRSRYSFLHDNCPPGSPDATRWASRPTHGGADNYETTVLADFEHHDWLWIERVGDTFNGYSSEDGTDGSWVFTGTQRWDGAPESVLVGLAVTSHTEDCCQAPARITFDEVSLELGAGGHFVPLVALDPVGVEITWNVTREILGGGISYEIEIDEGFLMFDGQVEGFPVFGNDTFSAIPPPTEWGPLEDLGLEHAHAIGVECSETSVESCGAGCVTLAGAGNDIWRGGDQFLYAYGEVSGDFSATVTVVERQFAPGSRHGKHGIMARQDCSVRSRYSFIHDNGEALGDATRFAARPTHGGSDNLEILGPLPSGTHFDTLRLDRCGSEFIGYVRDDFGLVDPGNDGAWVEVGRWDWGDGAPGAVPLGLAVNSHQGCDVTTITFEDWEVRPYCAGPVAGLSCAINESGEVEITWENGAGTPAEPISIRVGGDEVALVDGTATGATLPLAELPEELIEVCVVNFSGQPSCCTLLNGDGLHINCGGLRLADALGTGIGDGRIWEEDSKERPSPFLVTPNAHTLDYATQGFIPPIRVADTTLTEPDYVDDPFQSLLFATERLDTADITYRIPVSPGDYDVTLLFAEGCCSGGCENIDDPASSGGPCRVIDILLNGVLVEDQFSQHVEAQRALGELGENLPNEDWGVALARTYTVRNATKIEVTLKDLGSGNPPDNPSIKGISVEKVTRPGPLFVRGDANSDNEINLTDGIKTLSFLFLGGPAPECRDAADADDNGELQITDAVRILSFLFLGAGPPPPPSPRIAAGYPAEDCGPDPSPEAPDLGCVTTSGTCGARD